MQTSTMSQAETDAFGPKILEQSEIRRRALETLSEPPRFKTVTSAAAHFLAAMLIGVGLGVMTYSDLNTYHPEVGKVFIYIMASVGALTGSAALLRAILNTRRLDAVATLLLSSYQQGES